MTRIKSKKKLKESYDSKIYTIEGFLIFSNERNIADILSDIRAISGITILRTIQSSKKGNREILRVSLKIDPSPFDTFNQETLENILDEIKKIPGVVSGKYTSSLKAS